MVPTTTELASRSSQLALDLTSDSPLQSSPLGLYMDRLPTLADRIKSRGRRASQQPKQDTFAVATSPHQSKGNNDSLRPSQKRPLPSSNEKPKSRRRKLSPQQVAAPEPILLQPTVSKDKGTQISAIERAVAKETSAAQNNSTQTLVTGPVFMRETRSTASKATQTISEAKGIADTPPPSVIPFKETAATEAKATQTNPAQGALAGSTPRAPRPDDIRPVNDTAGYEIFVAQMIKALKVRVTKSQSRMFGDRQNKAMLHLLEHASPTNDQEMLFLSGAEAKEKLAPGVFHNGPILTEGQQPLPLQSIQDFLGEYYDDEAKCSIQDPSVIVARGNNFAREVTIGAVKRRLLEGKTKGRPWNCLELATHVEDGLRPTFLSDQDTRLLTKVKLEPQHDNNDLSSYAGRRGYPQGYKEVEKWALVAESGALTEPHQDSHGYSTYITVNQGTVGFGWMSYPTEEERKAWIQHNGMAAERFRYVVMQPGQTVYFPAGTIHFVFRLPSAGHTLAFGGHVLRCSNIVHWVKCLLEEKINTNITNEDLTTSAPGYLDRVEKFVKQAQKNGTVDKWGGAEAIEEFLRLKEEFMAT